MEVPRGQKGKQDRGQGHRLLFPMLSCPWCGYPWVCIAFLILLILLPLTEVSVANTHKSQITHANHIKAGVQLLVHAERKTLNSLYVKTAH